MLGFKKNNILSIMNKMNKTIINLYHLVLPYLHKVGMKIKSIYKAYIALYKRSKWYNKIAIIAGTGVASLIVLLFLIDINFLFLFGKSPSMFNIKDPMQSIASEIYSSEGKLRGKYYSENRSPVEYDEISPILINTLVCTEDERFYKHFGIDFKGLFSAAKDYVVHGDARGASTITQQLVKNLFKVRSQYSTGLLGKIPGIKLLIMKSKEWVTAVKIESLYSKEDILTMYFNTVDFGSNTYGIKTACNKYFNTTPKKITVGQAAVLVGLWKATTYYNAIINPQNSRNRRNSVLGKLKEHNIISNDQYTQECKKPIVLSSKIENNYQGSALYFRDAVANYLKEWCKENNYDMYTDGLKIYTTINSRMQKYAEEAVEEHLGHYLQPLFFKEKQGRSTAPFTNKLSRQQVNSILNRYVRQSGRYHDMKASGASEEEIKKAFH